MTEQETAAIDQLSRRVRGIARRMSESSKKIDRIERALLGDVPFGDMGLIMEHEAVLTRLGNVEAAVIEHAKALKLIYTVLRQFPIWTAAVLAFVAASGGDVGAILQLLSGIVK